MDMASKGVHKGYSRSLNYHAPQSRGKPPEQMGGQSSLLASSDFRRPPGSSYGDELMVGADAGRPRSKSQSAPRTVSKSVSPQIRRASHALFSEQQKQLLRHSWLNVGKHGHSGIGSMIFRRVFARRPSLRGMFDFGATPTPRLQHDAVFEIHARNFVNVIDGAIRSLDTFEDDYVPVLLAKGRFHAQFAERGLKSEYWDVFAEAMAESAVEWIGPGRHRETVRAWTLLVACIVDRMRAGYEEEVRRKRKSNSSSYLQSNGARYGMGNGSGNQSVTPSPLEYSPNLVAPHSSAWVRVNEDSY